MPKMNRKSRAKQAKYEGKTNASIERSDIMERKDKIKLA